LILEFITSIDIEKSKNGGWERRQNEILTVSDCKVLTFYYSNSSSLEERR